MVNGVLVTRILSTLLTVIAISPLAHVPSHCLQMHPHLTNLRNNGDAANTISI